MICFVYFIFLVGTISRDIRLQNILINRVSRKEFTTLNLFCDELTRCTRIGGESLGLIIQNFIDFFANIFHGNPSWQQFYLTDMQYFSIYNGLSSITFRILCLIPIFIYFNRIFKANMTANLLAILCFTSVFTGMPLYYLNNLFGIYLVNYDYMVIFVMSLLLLFYKSILDSPYLFFAFTFLCTITMENLGLILTAALIVLKLELHRKIRLVIYSISIVIFSYLILLSGVLIKNGTISTNQSDGRYRNLNVDKIAEILGAMFIILVWSLILGYLVGILGYHNKPLGVLEIVSLRFNKELYLGIAYGYFVSFLFGFFVSILTEFARQFIFLQIVIFLIGVNLAITSLIKKNSRII